MMTVITRLATRMKDGPRRALNNKTFDAIWTGFEKEETVPEFFAAKHRDGSDLLSD